MAARNVLVILAVSLFYFGLFFLPYTAGFMGDARRYLTFNTVKVAAREMDLMQLGLSSENRAGKPKWVGEGVVEVAARR